MFPCIYTLKYVNECFRVFTLKNNNTFNLFRLSGLRLIVVGPYGHNDALFCQLHLILLRNKLTKILLRHQPRLLLRRPSSDVRRSIDGGPCATSPGTRDVRRLSEFRWICHPAGHSQTVRRRRWHLPPASRSHAAYLPPRDDWCCAGWGRWAESSSLLHCNQSINQSISQ